MIFKKIDEETVCCIVSESDMNDHGLEVEDFLQNKEKVQNFLHTIVERAEEEVGYEMKRGVISMQVAMLPEHNLAITFSEKENLGIRDMIEQMRKAMTSLDEDGAESSEILQQLETQTNQVKEFLEKEIENPESEEKPKVKKNAKRRRVGIFTFDSMREVISCCKSLGEELTCRSELYHDQDCYEVILDSYGTDDRDYLKICGCMIEFGRFHSNKRERVASIREHASCVIERNALEVLRQL